MFTHRKFALTPGLTDKQPIDYMTKCELRHWTDVTGKLSEKLYDMLRVDKNNKIRDSRNRYKKRCERYRRTTWRQYGKLQCEMGQGGPKRAIETTKETKLLSSIL